MKKHQFKASPEAFQVREELLPSATMDGAEIKKDDISGARLQVDLLIFLIRGCYFWHQLLNRIV
jgi:hypothetical protein